MEYYYNYSPPDGRSNILQIGAGGNGSWLAKHISRLFNFNSYIIVDGDNVERKNLIRQNFTISDLGENKAQALAVRYSRIFGKEIGYIPNFLNESNLRDEMRTSSIIISCLDNNKSRRIIYNEFKKKPNMTVMWIDLGNDLDWGQIFISGGTIIRDNSKKPALLRQGKDILLFDVIKYFEAGKHPGDMSCAERMEAGLQNPIINNFMAITAMNIIYNIIKGIKVDYYKLIINTRNTMTKYYLKDLYVDKKKLGKGHTSRQE